MEFQELDNDQRRERVNTQQRYAAWREAKARAQSYRGSLVWHEMKGDEYLVRSYYDASGNRRQKSEGKRGPETEKLKADWERARAEATDRLKSMRDAVTRQAAINRAVGLARVPLVGARIIRAIDEAGLLGNGIRIVGTNAIYAYEAAAGVMVDPGITTTQDIDLLMDARMHLRIAASETIPEPTLIALLKQVDKSFERTDQNFRASNKDGYLVDLIRPLRNPPWLKEREQIGEAEDDSRRRPSTGSRGTRAPRPSRRSRLTSAAARCGSSPPTRGCSQRTSSGSRSEPTGSLRSASVTRPRPRPSPSSLPST